MEYHFAGRTVRWGLKRVWVLNGEGMRARFGLEKCSKETKSVGHPATVCPEDLLIAIGPPTQRIPRRGTVS